MWDIGRHRVADGDDDPNTLSRLADLLAWHQVYDDMLPLLATLVDSGVPFADHRLIATLAATGNQQDAYRLARFGLTPDGDIESRPAQPG